MGIVVYKEAQELDILGKRFYIAHGDGLGYAPFSFRIMNGIFHSPFCQALFKILHPDLGISFGLRWSRHSYYKRKTMELAYLGEGKEHLIQFAKKTPDHCKAGPRLLCFRTSPHLARFTINPGLPSSYSRRLDQGIQLRHLRR
jgi:hypothetical protein